MNGITSLSVIHAYMFGILALLTLATTTVLVLKQLKPGKNFTEPLLRIRTWWLIILLLFGALLLSRGSAIVFFGLISYLGFKEFITLIPTRQADHRVLVWAYCAIPVQYFWAYIEWYGMFIIYIPIFMFLLLPVRMLLRGQTEGFLKTAGTLQWGLMTTVLSLSHLAYLLVLPDDGPAEQMGVGLVLYLISLTEINDVTQYLWGKSCGHRKVVPEVSPNKTWAGLAGGVATTTLLAPLLAPMLTPLSVFHALLVGSLIGLSGFFGDICISAVKRDIGIKDTGTLLPGHGGILDRVDSLTFTAPLFFHFVHYFYF
ncbi:phosphatidate cytidylyltransferase, putative [Syntrophotalea carbinolica DSM 2380]|uniref:Phosphatidate cytidylyltransferase n=1 Tax=Syntrophotalea carbinolica (strain DSM 2380 / NBRC 103641 / GraBd1) TaxID=338963 RepID=Q3A0U4_SYNC1|nr:phosphatidate cytidylyltransferase [Syntrophotalea carbinolica]ABA90013.1 phosphatidate cytidylyltransferase, putative [Syntrophotalea carbinolica DSM 2380]